MSTERQLVSPSIPKHLFEYRYATMAKDKRDPRAPKRNMSAYLLYQNAMRETFKAQNPGMTFGQLAKYTSAMYAEMAQNEKDAWHARAEADKARYLNELATYVPAPGYDAKGDALAGPATKVSRSRGKLVKDQNAPKRNMSAYLLYQNAMRDHFKGENPGMTFGQLAKYTSHMYKSLTPEEKGQWEARAAYDKERYDQEMVHYIPPPGHNAQGVLIDNCKYGRKAKKVKDPNAPKRARGSFVFFTFEMRPRILQEYPGIKFVEMGTMMGERWRALPPVEKKRYEDMAAADKQRFNTEMQRYNTERGMIQELQAVNQHVQSHQAYMDPHHGAMAHPQAPVPAPQAQHALPDPNAAYPAPVAAYDPNLTPPHTSDPNVSPVPVHEPGTAYADPAQGYADPTQAYAGHTQSYTDPTQAYVDPTPTQTYSDPAHNYSDPAAFSADPNAAYSQQIPDAQQQVYDQQVY